MRDPTEKYLEDVLCYADLAPGDERTVRAELNEHLQTLLESAQNLNPKEITAMLNEQFGHPKKVGRAIALAKGRLRTFFKKQRRTLPWKVAAIVILFVLAHYTVAQAFYVPGEGASPMIPRGSRVLVNKLAHDFTAGDVLVFRNSTGQYLLGTVLRPTDAGGWVVERNKGDDKLDFEITPAQVVGRVFLNTR
jgi:hypothetical protein